MTNYEPTATEIIDQMTRGWDWPVARRKCIENFEASLRALNSVSPESAEEITAAAEAATTAQRRADQKLSEGNQAIARLQESIMRLGLLRDREAAVRALVATPESTAATAEALLDAFVANKTQGTPYSKGMVQSMTTTLLEITAIQPYAGPYADKLKAEAETLAKQIRATAKTEKINLPRLLENMRAGALSEDGRNVRNLDLMLQIERGAFLDLL